jgi:LysM repeat protein
MYDKLEINFPVNLHVIAEALSVSIAELRKLNPELRKPMTPPVPSYTIRIPQGKKEQLATFISDPVTEPARYRIYRAKAGENLAYIARTKNVNLNHLKRLNNLAHNTVYTGRIIFIPSIEFGHLDEAFAQDIASLAPRYYVVRRGDNLTSISRKHNMSLQTLLRLNPNLNPRKNIYPGQVLVVSHGGTRG